MIQRYGEVTSAGAPMTEPGPSSQSNVQSSVVQQERQAAVDSIRNVMAPILSRLPNEELVVVAGLEKEMKDAERAAERDYQWARGEEIVVDNVTQEDFLRPPAKKRRIEPTAVERAARGQTSKTLSGWEKWASKRSQKAPDDSWFSSRNLAPGEWVRIRGGTYNGDKAMVYDECHEVLKVSIGDGLG